MSELWLLAVLPALAWMLVKLKELRKPQVERPERRQFNALTVDEMGELVTELSPTLKPSSKVTSPNFEPDSSHVWSSPSGKRVYMN